MYILEKQIYFIWLYFLAIYEVLRETKLYCCFIFRDTTNISRDFGNAIFLAILVGESLFFNAAYLVSFQIYK